MSLLDAALVESSFVAVAAKLAEQKGLTIGLVENPLFMSFWAGMPQHRDAVFVVE